MCEDDSSVSSSSVEESSDRDGSVDSSNSTVLDISSDSSKGGDSSSLCSEDEQETVLDESEHAVVLVREWTNAIPIGLGLCPWAMKSRQKRRLRYEICHDTTLNSVSESIRSQARALCSMENPLWSTTLIVCPNVAGWNDKNEGFQVFDDFVKHQAETLKGDEIPVTLVPFHPNFLRWRGLPEGVKVGSEVTCYKANVGGIFQKSSQRYTATVLETENPVFGLRKIKVQFHDCDKGSEENETRTHGHETRKEQYVPIDWLVPDKKEEGFDLGLPLPDNAMHRAPHPTVHLIRDEDLAKLQAREVSRVKRKNAQKMMKLGWEGVADRIERLSGGV